MVVTFEACGEENAYYDPSDRSVSLCYELIDRYVQELGDSSELALDEAGSEQATSDAADSETSAAIDLETAALDATLFHELGHAFVDILELPITGPEKDVVDEFAAVLLLWIEDEQSVLAGIDQFAVDAIEEESFDEIPYWDEHGLSAQRLYNTTCFLYGSDPDYWEELVDEEEGLPPERAELCPEEYERKSEHWQRLLEPFLKADMEP